MEKLGEVELDELFLDVRKSYRLLYHYQKHVLDLAKFIGNRIGFEFRSGWSLFSNNASNGKKVNLDKWAWDWTGMYGYQFYFKDETIENEPLRFAINLYSDTGFYDNLNNSDKLNVESFNPANKSETKLVFIASKGNWDWKKLFNGRSYEAEFIENVLNKDDNITVGKAYKLSKFSNEESAISMLDDFIKFCKVNGLNVQRESKEKK
jgi:hypothetical protein